jgi:hypothetical protein
LIHREWIMLMLGESVLSLLIVEVSEQGDYYKSFFSGIVSITLLEFLHFQSQPNHPEDHAMRRNRHAGFAFANLMTVYSAALVVLGTSYKMILYEYVYEESGIRRRSLFPMASRWLASDGDASGLDPEERRQRIAHFFCFSMALVFLCSDVMILVHRGLEDNLGRCRFTHTGSRRVISLVLVMLRVGLIVFIATLSQYCTEPVSIAFIGLLAIMSQVGLRFVGSAIFESESEHPSPDFDVSDSSEEASSKWPNVTQPRVHHDHAEKSVEH